MKKNGKKWLERRSLEKRLRTSRLPHGTQPTRWTLTFSTCFLELPEGMASIAPNNPSEINEGEETGVGMPF